MYTAVTLTKSTGTLILGGTYVFNLRRAGPSLLALITQVPFADTALSQCHERRAYQYGHVDGK